MRKLPLAPIARLLALWSTLACAPLGRSETHLFFDSSFLASTHGVVRRVHQPAKLPAPVLVGDEPWENWAVDPHGSPCLLWDEEDKIYKLWYQAYSVVPPHTERYIMCYAISQDGLVWHKPKLGLFDYRGSRENNIVLMGNSQWALTNVIKDAHEKDPQRRYKSLSWDDHAISVAFSPDGTHWTLYSGNPVVRGTGDSHNIMPYDEATGRYVAYMRPNNHVGEGIRVIGYSTSPDFIHWSPIEVILHPDKLDLVGEEFYQMPVMRYAGAYVGFLWVYHNTPHWPWAHGPFDPANLRGNEQTLENQLTYSYNGKDFIRVGDRATFLPVGTPGSWDCGMVVISTVIPHDNELWIYYSGSTSRHFFEELLNLGKVVNGQRWMVAMGLAKLRRDGFVSLHSGKPEGEILTRTFTPGPSTTLTLNAHAGRGEVSVEAVDDHLRPIPGFTRRDFTPLQGDSVSFPCHWNGHTDLAPLAGKEIHLRIYLRRADLYSLDLKS